MSTGLLEWLNNFHRTVLPGILVLLIFLAAAGLMLTRRLPALLALPLMALSIGLVAGMNQPDWSWSGTLQPLLFDKILGDGSKRLAGAMVTTMFGAILSQVVMRQGIARQLVRLAAEYAGDRKQLLALVLFTAVAANFSALSGLGAVIMVGSLVLPILVSSGFSPRYAATLMLLGIGLGAAAFALSLAVLAIYVADITLWGYNARQTQGWTSLILAIFFLSGTQLFGLGVLGEYIGRIFEEAKGRPTYVVEERLGSKGGDESA